MYRLNEEYFKRQDKAPLLTERSRDYIQDFYFGTQLIEIPRNTNFLSESIEAIGVEQFVYASDYPLDYDPPNTIEDLEALSEEERD